MSVSLYELTNNFLETMNQLESMELDQETINDTLESLQMPLEEKAENVVKYIKSLEALADAKKLEAKRLSDSASADLKKAESLKTYLQSNLERANIKKLQAGVFALSFRKGSEVVEVDEMKLPKEYWLTQVIEKPVGKPELKKLIKSGVEIPGVHIMRKPDTLTIK